MGRKLNAFEEASFASPETDCVGRDLASLSRSQHLQRRIAEQLGVSVAQLRPPGDLPNPVHVAGNSAQGIDTALSRECVELIEAYTRITNPAQRLRCLQAVREFAAADPSCIPGVSDNTR